jgi:hypothetical protein
VLGGQRTPAVLSARLSRVPLMLSELETVPDTWGEGTTKRLWVWRIWRKQDYVCKCEKLGLF